MSFQQKILNDHKNHITELENRVKELENSIANQRGQSAESYMLIQVLKKENTVLHSALEEALIFISRPDLRNDSGKATELVFLIDSVLKLK